MKTARLSLSIASTEAISMLVFKILRVFLALVGFGLAIFGMLYAADQIIAHQVLGVLKALVPTGTGVAIVILALIMEP